MVRQMSQAVTMSIIDRAGQIIASAVIKMYRMHSCNATGFRLNATTARGDQRLRIQFRLVTVVDFTFA